MKVLYFLKARNKPALGILCKKGILDIDAFQDFNGKALFSNHNLSLDDLQLLNKIMESENIQPHFYLDESKLTIASCTPNPSKIICIGLNYRKHAIESNMPIPAIPIVFNKFNNTLINFQQDVSLGKVGEQFDYEVELGVVIGRECKNVSKENALDFVLGYCVANDLSCRDLQFRSSQWLMGKSLDNFLPLGKYIVTADEVGDPQRLQLSCTVNGKPRQNSNTSDMIFTVAEIIEDLSKHMTLEPGDLILTGTPAGVILGLPEKNWLKPGDIVKVEIEKIGSTENIMVE
jgi:2-keto-4-pentenoate hydratase/2-oxohepta-3-ene-1,7-dioic acid hydratase in catechol pathway